MRQPHLGPQSRSPAWRLQNPDLQCRPPAKSVRATGWLLLVRRSKQRAGGRPCSGLVRHWKRHQKRWLRQWRRTGGHSSCAGATSACWTSGRPGGYRVFGVVPQIQSFCVEIKKSFRGSGKIRKTAGKNIYLSYEIRYFSFPPGVEASNFRRKILAWVSKSENQPEPRLGVSNWFGKNSELVWHEFCVVVQ